MTEWRTAPRRKPHLSTQEQEELRELLDQGPVEGVDARSVFFGEDIRTLIQRYFGKTYALSGVYELLHRMNYSWLCPRPRNPKGDPAEQEAFKKSRRRPRRHPSSPPGQTRARLLSGRSPLRTKGHPHPRLGQA